MSQVLHLAGRLLRLEEEVRWFGGIGTAAAEAARGRERPPEAFGSGLSLDKEILQEVVRK